MLLKFLAFCLHTVGRPRRIFLFFSLAKAQSRKEIVVRSVLLYAAADWLCAFPTLQPAPQNFGAPNPSAAADLMTFLLALPPP
jgi:hypothetical protein